MFIRPFRALGSPPPALLWLILGGVTLLSPAGSPAQGEPSELQALREAYLSGVASANRTLTDQYIEALKRHERELGLSGNYQDAIEVASRVSELQKRNSSWLESGPVEDERRIVLRAGNAKMTKGVAYDNMRDLLTNWGESGCGASWSILRMQPGEYEVRITYAVDRPGRNPDFDPRDDSSSAWNRYGGTFLFTNINTLRPSESTEVEFTLNSTGSWDEFDTLTIDTIEFDRSSANVKVEALRPGDDPAALIRNVEFVPVSGPDDETDSGQSRPDSPTANGLDQLRESYRERFENAASDPVATYSRLLEELRPSYAAAGRRTEAEAASHSPADSLQKFILTPVDANPFPMDGNRHIPGGFVVLDGVDVVDHPDNRVDSFRIRHRGREFPVRLYFLTAPSPNPDSHADNQAIADYFDISHAEARTLAVHGMNVLSHCLREYEVTLVTRWVADDQGRYYVRCVLSGFGSLERTLVGRGLAAIRGRVIDSPHMPAAAYVNSVLREAERSARENRRGGWGMVRDSDASPEDLQSSTGPPRN